LQQKNRNPQPGVRLAIVHDGASYQPRPLSIIATVGNQRERTSTQTAGLLDYLATIGKDTCGVDTEIGLGGVPFGIEYRQVVTITSKCPMTIAAIAFQCSS
jgi:hypothetical protein